MNVKTKQQQLVKLEVPVTQYEVMVVDEDNIIDVEEWEEIPTSPQRIPLSDGTSKLAVFILESTLKGFGILLVELTKVLAIVLKEVIRILFKVLGIFIVWLLKTLASGVKDISDILRDGIAFRGSNSSYYSSYKTPSREYIEEKIERKIYREWD